MTRCFVGFDTSNYTTSASVCTEGAEVIANLKRPLAVKEGERGLRQSDALFAHVKNLPSLADELKAFLREGGYSVLAVGASARPRDVEGSYMPCFLSGVAAASAFASGIGAPVYDFSHQAGHIMAAAYSSGEMERLLRTPFMAFHVSGGTTEALLVRDNGSSIQAELIGETRDLNAGQVIDRTGVMLGLKFPCGAALEALARDYRGELPKTRISVSEGGCNLSGLENIATSLYEKSGDKNAVAALVFDFLCRTLIEMCRQLTCKYGRMPILFAGGVMSNTLMRDRIRAEFEAYFSEPQFSADNAAGIALLTRREFLKK